MDTKKAPEVSIILPTYNGADYILHAIKSVIDQSFKDWELIVVNDASTDETSKILDDISQDNKRIRILNNESNLYITESLNRGLAKAQGEFIARLDDDDYWVSEQKLEKQVNFFRTHSNYAVVGGGVILIDREGNEIYRYFKKEKDSEIRKSALLANPFSHTTVMFRTDIVRKAGGYGEKRYAEDWDLWLRMGKYGKFYNFQEYFTAYTMSLNNRSFIYQRPQGKRVLEIIREHKNEYPRFYIGYIVNISQLFYAYLPVFLRRRLHLFLSNLKRRTF